MKRRGRREDVFSLVGSYVFCGRREDGGERERERGMLVFRSRISLFCGRKRSYKVSGEARGRKRGDLGGRGGGYLV